MEINVLGTKYEIIIRNYDELEIFKDKGWEGYTDAISKKIVVGNIHTFPGYEKETADYCGECIKETMRHEIVHAFLNESGLQVCSCVPKDGWARNEEMIDWISLQFPKMLEAMKAAGCI